MTYSIVARDPDSGEFGVAVQSHYFGTGRVVPWARPGVGAVATQAAAEIAHGPNGLERMAAGASASEALAAVLADDPDAASRQLAMVDANGLAAAHTGADCITHAGHVTAENVSCQGNIMASPEIWSAMLAAYGAATDSGAPMARRLLAAMDAAEALGGDVRGRQSAAILVVPAEGEPWRTTVELRIEDHPEPLLEMHRLLDISDGYALADAGEEALLAGDQDRARELFSAALAAYPDSHELKFWTGTTLVHAGDQERGLALVREAIAAQPGWAWLVPRLDEAKMPGVGEVAAALGLSAED